MSCRARVGSEGRVSEGAVLRTTTFSHHWIVRRVGAEGTS
jgi:hypothetical protein